MDDRYEIASAFADMWRQSRHDAGKSQEYMARAMGVSKKTIQNWEDGTSCPNQRQGFEWFICLGLQPLPYYLKLMFPDAAKGESEEDVTEALFRIIGSLPLDAKRKLLYIASGEHGSSPSCVLEMIVAHLHAPLMTRINVADIITNNYKLSEAQGLVNKASGCMPNMELLSKASFAAKRAVVNGDEGYSAFV